MQVLLEKNIRKAGRYIMPVLELDQLVKRYGKNNVPAVDHFSYRFENGVYGLLGPNGAGKTTLLRLITGGLLPDAGTVFYNGQDIDELGAMYRADLGYMPQQQQLYDTFSVRRFLFYFAALKGLKKKEAKEKIAELLSLTGLTKKAGVLLKTLSGGMKQRVLLCAALVNDPKLLILDEPTAGLDPKERMHIKNYIYRIACEKTVLIATHVIPDIEQIAREVLFMQHGRVVLSGRPDEVIKKVQDKIFEVVISRNAYEHLSEMYPINRVSGEREDRIHVRVISDAPPTAFEAAPADVSLEDVYLYLDSLTSPSMQDGAVP